MKKRGPRTRPLAAAAAPAIAAATAAAAAAAAASAPANAAVFTAGGRNAAGRRRASAEAVAAAAAAKIPAAVSTKQKRVAATAAEHTKLVATTKVAGKVVFTDTAIAASDAAAAPAATASATTATLATATATLGTTTATTATATTTAAITATAATATKAATFATTATARTVALISAPAVLRGKNDDDALQKELLSSSSSQGSLDIGACCLCHCALDYSDDAAFDETARLEDRSDDGGGASSNGDNGETQKSGDGDDDSYYFRRNDPYLPRALRDAGNALLYCDSCPRLYHQRCHFCPVLTVPAGPWHCLVCQVQQQQQQHTAGTQKRKKINPKAITGRSKHQTSSKAAAAPVRQQMQHYPYEIMFQSPPVPTAAQFEASWECDPHVVAFKAVSLHRTLTHTVPRPLQTAAARYQRAASSLETLASSARNRQHFLAAIHNHSRVLSQELVQCLGTMASARHKLRGALLDLERARSTHEQRSAWAALQQWLAQHESNGKDHNSSGGGGGKKNAFVERTLFPFGALHPRRWYPVTAEYYTDHNDDDDNRHHYRDECYTKNATTTEGVPTVIVVGAGADKIRTRNGGFASKLQISGKAEAKAPVVGDGDDDGDDGISLDGLKCCVCFKGESSDDNDVILCDGRGCYRAYHMQCVHPRVLLIDEDADWFCPLCQTVADMLLKVQTATAGGDEWEQRRLLRHQGSDDNESLKSWEVAADVFPQADWEYETARLLKQGIRNADTDLLLERVLGIEQQENDDNGVVDADNFLEADDDNVDEDGHFDMYSYQEERRIEREERKNDIDNGSMSSHSSQVTLVELSSVELNVGEDELAALTDVDDDDNENDSDRPAIRQSRRLRNKSSLSSQQVHGFHTTKTSSDPGKMDTSNIVVGKRKRRAVDYRKLNDAIFGDVSEGELARIDGGDDFVFAKKKELDSSDGDSNDDDSNDDDSNDGDSSDGDSKNESSANSKR